MDNKYDELLNYSFRDLIEYIEKLETGQDLSNEKIHRKEMWIKQLQNAIKLKNSQSDSILHKRIKVKSFDIENELSFKLLCNEIAIENIKENHFKKISIIQSRIDYLIMKIEILKGQYSSTKDTHIQLEIMNKQELLRENKYFRELLTNYRIK